MTADITNTVLAGVGLGVAVLGLGFVYWQIRKLRGATEAASKAASAARSEMVQQVTTAELGSVSTALDAFQNQLRAGQMEAALLSCQGIRRQLVGLRSRSAHQIPEERRTELAWAITTLTRIREVLDEPEETSAPTMEVAATNSEIERMIDLVVEWRESPLSLQMEASGHEQYPA